MRGWVRDGWRQHGHVYLQALLFASLGAGLAWLGAAAVAAGLATEPVTPASAVPLGALVDWLQRAMLGAGVGVAVGGLGLYVEAFGLPRREAGDG